VGGRLLRVVDERKGWRRPAATPSDDPRARDLTVSAIESGDPLWL
jgi:hypothetical protein